MNLTPSQQSTQQAYPTHEAFLKEQSPEQLLVNYSDVHEIRDAISTRRLTLEEMNDLYATSSFTPGVAYLAKWLIFFNKFTNINKGMPADTVEWVAVQLYSKYCHFSFADLKVIFGHLLESRYGKFYGSVDTVLILTAFREYDIERNRLRDKEKERIEVEKKLWYNQRICEVNQEVFDYLNQKYPHLDDDKKYHMQQELVKQKMTKEVTILFGK